MTPKIFLAHLREMIGRFDPAYFLPKYQEYEKRLKDSGLPVFCLSRWIESIDSGIGIYDLSDKAGWRYLNVNNIVSGGIDDTKSGFIATPPDFKDVNVIQRGDIITGRVGTIGVFVKYADDMPAYISDNVFRIRLKDCDPDYILAVLNSSIVQNQIERTAKGSLQRVVNKQTIRNLKIPVPPPEVQSRIVAELDAAYAAKRKADEKAAQLLASIGDVVLSELGIPKLPSQDTSLLARIFTVSSSEIFENRIDAIAYQDLRRQFVKNVGKSRYPNVPLGALVNVNRQQTDSLNGRQYVGLENIDGVTGDFLPTQDKESLSSAVLFNEGEILFPKLRPYLNKVWLASFDGAASTEFYPLQSKTEDASYLAAYLRTKAVANVMTLLMTGNTLPRVQLEDILSLPVPVPPHSVQRRIVEKVSAIREEAKRLKSAAAEALSAAKSSMGNEILAKG